MHRQWRRPPATDSDGSRKTTIASAWPGWPARPSPTCPRPRRRASRHPLATVESEAEADEGETGEYAPEPIASNDYWTTGDQLEYRPYAVAISEFVQHEATAPPLTIGIKAPWGAGKTSLMRMIQDRLDPPTSGTEAAGRESRRRVRLSPRSRRLLAPKPRRWWSRRPDSRPGGDAPPDVSNRAVLRKLHQSASGKADDLEIEPPNLPGWRPTVWFNPWMYQSGEQVWAGLAYEVITQVTDRMHRADREAFWLELNVRRVDADVVRRRVHKALLERLLPLAAVLGAVVLVAAVVAICRSLVPGAAERLATGAQALLAGGTAATVIAGLARARAFWRENVAGTLTALVRPPDYTRSLAQLAERQGSGLFADTVRDPGYESQLGQLHHVQADMRRVLDLVATKRQPVVIFVGDLDRCSPSTVAQVIEAINLFLAGQFPNCVFVVAMEPEMIAAHIEVAYQPLVEALTEDDYWGEVRTLGWRFLDKIIQLPISLPALRSDQANEFLGATLVDRFRPATTGQNDDAVGEHEVSRIADGIRRRGPSIADISDAAAAVQRDRQGMPPTGGFSPETRAAMRRELRRRLRPNDPEVAEVVAAAAGRLGKNPREIKRFVNVFRFYAVVRQERITAGLPAPDTLAEVAKLALLAIRWPHLRAALGRQIGATERDTVLSLLEAPVAELPEDADWAARKEALRAALVDAKVPDRLRANLLASDDLCKLLASGPAIGTTAAIFL
ncbi:P-loop NTPase fold protein [Phytohabitans flavus]|uniref:KAP family P-loop NTPase fold protein n=1 Tax=Phytohabitans flavus TaxID=1076124 RepID=UPI0036379EA0